MTSIAVTQTQPANCFREIYVIANFSNLDAFTSQTLQSKVFEASERHEF